VRPQGWHRPNRGVSPLGPRPPGQPCRAMKCRGTSKASQCGRTECAPPRKRFFAPSPGPPPQGLPRSDGPPRGGAGSARPQCRHHANPNVAFFGRHAVANEPVTVTCPGLRPARIRGRGDRAPPRKPPFAPYPGFPRKALLTWIAHLVEGRAPHARNERIGFTRACPH